MLLERYLPAKLWLRFCWWRSRQRKQALGPYARAILTESENGRLLVDAADLVIGSALAASGGWSVPRMRFLCRLARSNWNALIVGAHVGSILVPLSRHVKKITGLEPNPNTFELLQANLLLNQVSNARLEQWAAGDRPARVPMQLNTHNSGGSKLAIGDASHIYYTYDHPRRVEVWMRTIDEAFAGERFDFVLLDAEGAETLVLRGMKETLRHVDILQMEIRKGHLQRIARVDLSEALAPLTEHFDYVWWEDMGGDPQPRARFVAAAQEILGRQDACDLLFFRSAYLDSVQSAWATVRCGHS